MPSEGDMNPRNASIEPSLRTVTNKLARGLYQLMPLATQRSPEGRVLLHHEAITEYLTSTSNGEYFFPKDIEHALLEALEQACVLIVHTLPAAEDGGDEQYYYDFILEPLVHPSMDTNEML
jgi:hypothetical protein